LDKDESLREKKVANISTPGTATGQKKKKKSKRKNQVNAPIVRGATPPDEYFEKVWTRRKPGYAFF
jgi:hypothetical protein